MEVYILGALVGLILLIVFLHSQNNTLSITKIDVPIKALPNAFEGVNIIHLSDIHGKRFGKNQQSLIEKVNACKPDYILVTGDLIDHRRYNEQWPLFLLQQLRKTAPIYFVTGNHEFTSGKYEQLHPKLIQLGVQVIRNAVVSIKREQGHIHVV
ncbi:MAG: metallophosphoesterase, partial [Hyphomonadaceae bacterium]|nr:metallophosphoesterase [Clostridia bacterium]